MNVHRNIIRADLPSGQNIINLTLPDGYSYEKIYINYLSNIWGINYCAVLQNHHYTFPPVNLKSPCTFKLNISDATKESAFQITIEKFGQIPDSNYFSKAFEPILVTGDDGKEYNIIPSNQFK